MTETRGWTRQAVTALARLPEWIRLTLEDWLERARLRRELDDLQQRGELDRTLIDSGLSPSDMPRLMHAHPHTPEQLAQMMRRLGIDRAHLPRDAATAAKLRAMEWRCGECAAWRRCRTWLASGEIPEEYCAFCPNAVAFDELRHAKPAACCP